MLLNERVRLGLYTGAMSKWQRREDATMRLTFRFDSFFRVCFGLYTKHRGRNVDEVPTTTRCYNCVSSSNGALFEMALVTPDSERRVPSIS